MTPRFGAATLTHRTARVSVPGGASASAIETPVGVPGPPWAVCVEACWTEQSSAISIPIAATRATSFSLTTPFLLATTSSLRNLSAQRPCSVAPSELSERGNPSAQRRGRQLERVVRRPHCAHGSTPKISRTNVAQYQPAQSVRDLATVRERARQIGRAHV